MPGPYGKKRPERRPGSAKLIYAVDAEAYQLVDSEILHAAGFQLGDEFGRDAVNSHGDELIGFGMPIAEGLDFFDEVRGYAVDAEGD
jgi:hypothetical protein